MKITKYFWMALVIMVLLSFIPYILTMDAPAYDGSAVIGFPLVFNAYGGLCPPSSPCGFFSLTNLIADVLLILAVPVIVNYAVSRRLK